MDVLQRVRRSFNADEVTKKFYKDFKRHHDDLLGQIEGIDDPTHNSWYGSVLLNRLMFVYFLQKKGFLDDDSDYLKNRLESVRRHLGPDSFYGFFREFLLPLFHDGLGSHLHAYDDPAVARIIGDVPYVNGGIFSPHLLEETHAIEVPDEAFESIFSFFDNYRWHLDERPSEEPNEINPDVLGYIFEQYVNQKEQGAYYTKEDVTGYMATSTVVPAVIDRIGSPEDLWLLLTIDPDRYVWESVGYGSDEDLPSEIAAGLEDGLNRSAWSEKAPASHALPGETWWETLDRYERYRELVGRLENGEVTNSDDAVTANIDLRTLLEDHLRMIDTSKELESVWCVLSHLTILDPTCGSGAFLFAALEVMADLYEACVDRAIEISTDANKASFLRQLEDHPNRGYFVLKTAVLNNLFGVDIMYEAGEIARLRLFLKLAAQLNDRSDLEPLPDLDFNIKTGNLLVGIASIGDAERRLTQDLIGLSRLEDVGSVVGEAAEAYDEFVQSQSQIGDPSETTELKASLTAKLNDLRQNVDEFLYQARGETGSLSQWLESHQPFHWFIEFPRAFRSGGFDVVIGNPPYIRRNKVKAYRWSGFATDTSPDLYAVCVERGLSLAKENGFFSMIVPHSVAFSSDYRPVREVIGENGRVVWVSGYSLMPDSLFTGVRVRNVIIVSHQGAGPLTIYSGWRNRWTAAARRHLFQTLSFCEPGPYLTETSWPLIGSPELVSLFKEMLQHGDRLGDCFVKGGSQERELRFKKVGGYYVSMWPKDLVGDPPSTDRGGKSIPATETGSIMFDLPRHRDRALAVGLSKLFFLWWSAFGDDFHVTRGLIREFPLSVAQLPAEVESILDSAAGDLAGQLPEVVTYKGYKYKGQAGAKIANYYIPKLRHVTDNVDEAIVALFADRETRRALEVAYRGIAR